MRLSLKTLVMAVCILGLFTLSVTVFAQFGTIFITAGGETYTHVGGNAWRMQKSNDPTIYDFTKIWWNGQFLELQCTSQNHNHVRIYQNYVAYLQQLDDQHPNVLVWRSLANSTGHWQ